MTPASRHTVRVICVLLAGCALVALGVEMVARVGLERVSKIQRRTAAEYRLALEMGHDRDGRPHALVIGNSLLDEGVQFDRVHEQLLPEWDVRRFVVEQTAYYDWLYGLRRLFAEGARPDVVVLALTAPMWTSDEWRGDYSAHYLLRTTDAFDAARHLHLNATQTSGVLFANVSTFWGARAEIRNFVMGRLMPKLGDMMNFSSVVDKTPVVDEEIRHKVAPRLVALRQLAERYGARFVVLLPPVLASVDGARGMIEAGSDAHVPVLQPVASGTLARTLYRDSGFHLNPVGAEEFTTRLIPALREHLATLRTRAAARGPRQAGTPSQKTVQAATGRPAGS